MEWLKWKKIHTQTRKAKLWILLLVLFREKKKIDVWQLVVLLSPTELPFWLNPSYYPFVTYVCHCNFPFQLGWLLTFPILGLNRCLTRSLCSTICCLDVHKHPAFSKLIVYLIEICNCFVLWIIPVFPLSRQTPALFSLRNMGGLSWAEFMYENTLQGSLFSKESIARLGLWSSSQRVKLAHSQGILWDLSTITSNLVARLFCFLYHSEYFKSHVFQVTDTWRIASAVRSTQRILTLHHAAGEKSPKQINCQGISGVPELEDHRLEAVITQSMFCIFAFLVVLKVELGSFWRNMDAALLESGSLSTK